MNKAIEYNGLYWHSTRDRKLADRIKKKECKRLNIDLLKITDEMWLSNKDHCFGMIRKFISGL